jgi:hypothetical protein
VDRSDASALADLQMHWDEAYAIGLDGDIWSARFHGSTDDLRAHTSTELRELIRADYAYRQQVSRVQAAAARADDTAQADDDDLDDEDYATHFDGARAEIAQISPSQISTAQVSTAQVSTAPIRSGHVDSDQVASPDVDADNEGSAGCGLQDDAEPHLQAGLSRASLPRGAYANLRGERMST